MDIVEDLKLRVGWEYWGIQAVAEILEHRGILGTKKPYARTTNRGIDLNQIEPTSGSPSMAV